MSPVCITATLNIGSLVYPTVNAEGLRQAAAVDLVRFRNKCTRNFYLNLSGTIEIARRGDCYLTEMGQAYIEMLTNTPLPIAAECTCPLWKDPRED